jgi:aspartate kinase
MLLTAGERISMALMSMAIQREGVDAISFTGSQSGIITEDSHQGARIIEVRPYRIEDELKCDRVVIVAGYQGVSTKREITTLGRGGSDTTAVALAAALGAEACEIYSDVDGVYDADPRVCPQAQLITEITYEEMQSLAGAGAKVLNAQAVEFARRAGIKIIARKSGDSSGRETVVSGSAHHNDGVLGIVGAPQASVFRGESTQCDALLGALEPLGARVLAVSDCSGLVMAVNRVEMPAQSAETLAELAGRLGVSHEEASIVTLVGAGLLDGPVRDAMALLTDGDFEPELLAATGSWVSIRLAESRFADGVRALHARLTETASGAGPELSGC